MDLDTPALNAIGALGYAVARLLFVGLQERGGWIFLTIATLSLAWTCLRPANHDDAPGALIRHFLAVAFSLVLFFGPVAIDLKSEIGGRFAPAGTGVITSGAAPLPTYLVDQIGQSINRTVKSVLTDDAALVVPMLKEQLLEATTDEKHLKDGQVAANLRAWQLVAAALLDANAAFAAGVNGAQLRERLFNPVAMIDKYSTAKAVDEMRRVIEMLDAVPESVQLTELICNVEVLIADRMSAAVPWTRSTPCGEGSGSVIASMVSTATSGAVAAATAVVPGASAALAGKAARGAREVKELVDRSAALTGVSTFNRLSELYKSLGAASVVSAVVQAAQSNDYKILLGEACERHGADTCAQAFAGTYRAWEGKIQQTEESKPTIVEKVFGAIAAPIALLVSKVLQLLANLIAALTPPGIAAARAIAIILSLVGLYLLLLPGRAGDGIVWLIAPIAFANLWGTFYLFWWRISDILSSWSTSLLFAAGEVGASAIVQYVSAAGFLALPMVAWAVVFSMLAQLAPRGGVGGLIPRSLPALPSRGKAVRK